MKTAAFLFLLGIAMAGFAFGDMPTAAVGCRNCGPGPAGMTCVEHSQRLLSKPMDAALACSGVALLMIGAVRAFVLSTDT